MMGAAAQIAQGQPVGMLPSSKVLALLTSENLAPGEVATLLGVSRWTLAEWRLKWQGPPFILRARGVVVYPAERFISYLRALPQKDRREGTGAGCREN